MRTAFAPNDGDAIVEDSPSGQGGSLKIRYALPRPWGKESHFGLLLSRSVDRRPPPGMVSKLNHGSAWVQTSRILPDISNRSDPPHELPKIGAPIPDHGEVRTGRDLAVYNGCRRKSEVCEHLDEYILVAGRDRLSNLNI